MNATETAEAAETRKKVSSVFSLGWQVAELYPLLGTTDEAGAEGTDAPDGGLWGADELPAPQRLEHLRIQIATKLAKLDGQLGLPEEVEAQIDEAWTGYQTGPSSTTLQALHAALLGALSASDGKLGKAYDLGAGLSRTCVAPPNRTANWYSEKRVVALQRDLADLHTVLPDHAAMAVLGSLLMWEHHARELTFEQAETLPDQGRTWRALLSGDKSATHDLSLPDYVAAARRGVETARRFGAEILRSIFDRRRDATRAPDNEESAPWPHWPWVVLGVVVVVIVALVLAAAVIDGVNAWLAAAVTLVSGAGGLGYVKKLWDGMESIWDQVREPLLKATLDVFIAAAITQLPNEKKKAIADLRSAIERQLHPTALPRRPPSSGAPDAAPQPGSQQ